MLLKGAVLAWTRMWWMLLQALFADMTDLDKVGMNVHQSISDQLFDLVGNFHGSVHGFTSLWEAANLRLPSACLVLSF